MFFFHNKCKGATMRYMFFPLLLSGFTLALIACSSDSSSNPSGANIPAAGNTASILLSSDCDKIVQSLPVQPPYNYTSVYDAENEECVVTMPEVLDATVVPAYFNQLKDASKKSSISTYDNRVYLEYLDGFGLYFASKNDPSTFVVEFSKDCFNAAYVADIPEKDFTWIADEHSCSAYNPNATRPSNENTISMTEQQVRERIQELPLAGWIVTTGCDDHLDIYGSEYYCFQKQIDSYLFELGYGVSENDMLRSVEIAFKYKLIQ